MSISMLFFGMYAIRPPLPEELTKSYFSNKFHALIQCEYYGSSISCKHRAIQLHFHNEKAMELVLKVPKRDILEN